MAKYLIASYFFLLIYIGLSGQVRFKIGNQNQPDTSQIKEFLNNANNNKTRNIDVAFQWAKKALLLSEKTQYKPGLAKSYATLGNLFLLKKDYTTSLNYYLDAQSIIKVAQNELLLGEVLKNCGDVYAARSYYRQAFDSYRDAATIFKKLNQIKLLDECQEAMGNLALEFGRPRGALNLYTHSLFIKTKLNDVNGISNTSSKISKIYLTLKMYDSALYFNKEVQRLATKDEGLRTDATIDELIILSFQRKFKEAEEAKDLAEKLVAQQMNPSYNMKLLVAISNFYLAKKNKILYEKYFDSAAVLVKKARSPELAINGLSLLAEMSSQNEDYKTAYNMIKEMDKYKDIFRSENMERISAEIKNIAESNLKEKEIDYLSRENKLKIEKLNKETLLRLALVRQNILKDSTIQQQQLLTQAKENESRYRSEQLKKEKELSLSLGRENVMKQQYLIDEKKNKYVLWIGIGLLIILITIIYFLYQKQIRKNATIRKQSNDLEVLNKEIHHRVKNNLQVISSMLDLQTKSLNDPNAVEIIKEAIQRIQSMAYIHQNLYQGNAVNSVNMTQYIRMLSDHLFRTYNFHQEDIQLHTEIQDLNLHTDTAIPIGMILNELISNSLKYAFAESSSGDIWVQLRKQNDELYLQVKDNGVGLKRDFDPTKSNTFGYEIINAFAQKLRAQIVINGNIGTDVQLFISKFKLVI